MHEIYEPIRPPVYGFGLLSCDQDQSGQIIVRLTDSPGDYNEVNIDIRDVMVEIDGSKWYSLTTNSGIYDMLQLTGNAQIILAEGNIPSGNITQVQLVLGNQNTVVVGDQSNSLSISPGVKEVSLPVDESLIDGLLYTMLIDFDVARSVIEQNSGYELNPRIRLIDERANGAITGKIEPASESIAVYAISGSDTVGTSYSKPGSTKWYIGGLDSGLYDVHFEPGDLSGYQKVVISDISVSVSQITDIGSEILLLK